MKLDIDKNAVFQLPWTHTHNRNVKKIVTVSCTIFRISNDPKSSENIENEFLRLRIGSTIQQRINAQNTVTT